MKKACKPSEFKNQLNKKWKKKGFIVKHQNAAHLKRMGAKP
jgi:hypothetical protein